MYKQAQSWQFFIIFSHWSFLFCFFFSFSWQSSPESESTYLANEAWCDGLGIQRRRPSHQSRLKSASWHLSNVETRDPYRIIKICKIPTALLNAWLIRQTNLKHGLAFLPCVQTCQDKIIVPKPWQGPSFSVECIVLVKHFNQHDVACLLSAELLYCDISAVYCEIVLYCMVW